MKTQVTDDKKSVVLMMHKTVLGPMGLDGAIYMVAMRDNKDFSGYGTIANDLDYETANTLFNALVRNSKAGVNNGSN